MKATEARELSKKNEEPAAQRRATEWAEYQKKERAKLRAERKKENETLKWELEAAHRHIKEATQEGRYDIRMDVVSEKIGKRLVRILKREGFSSYVSWDTVFTGVDEWEEHYYVKISWGKE